MGMGRIRRSFTLQWSVGFDNDEYANVAYSTSNMKRTWQVRAACTNYVHLRFLLPQVALHLLGSESPLMDFDTEGNAGRL